MKKRSLLLFSFCTCIISACSGDSPSSSGRYVRDEESHNSSVVYGYDINGQLFGDKQGFETCRYDVYRFYDDIDLENDYTKAYSYMGLAGRTGAYLYYAYGLYFPVKKTYSFQMKEYKTCLYQEIWTVPAEANSYWSWSCNYSNTVTYSSYVGGSGRQFLPSGNKIISQTTYSVIPAENAGANSPTFVLYSDDTYIDVFVTGKQARFIQRLPSYLDMGTFNSK